MAGLGYKDFTAGAVLTAAQVDGYLMEQAVMNFAGTAARGSALTSVQAAGMVAHVGGGTLTVYNGTSWAEVYPGTTSTSGLTYLTQATFSAASAVNVNDVFSATYDTYMLKGYFTASVQGGSKIRMRVSSVDNSTAGQYYYAGGNTRYTVSSTIAGSFGSTTATGFDFLGGDSATSYFEATFFEPFASRLTGLTCNNIFNRAGATDGFWQTNSGTTTVTTSYTGFSIVPASGTITGFLRVYGLRNS